jgi:transcriptional regulator with XRE-family HTH domain
MDHTANKPGVNAFAIILASFFREVASPMSQGFYGAMEFSEKLKALSDSRRIFQEEIAERLDVSQSSVSSWMRGKTTPRLPEAIGLAKLFGVSVDYLADDSQEEPVVGLSDWEVQVLKVARRLGEDETMDRLFVGRLELRSLDPAKQLEARGGSDPKGSPNLVTKPRRA